MRVPFSQPGAYFSQRGVPTSRFRLPWLAGLELPCSAAPAWYSNVDGSGTVLIHGRGDFQRQELREGEELLVSTGNHAAFADTVDYNVRRVGALRKSLFGKEGFFVTLLVGPGIVLLQTLKRGQASQSSHLSAS